MPSTRLPRPGRGLARPLLIVGPVLAVLVLTASIGWLIAGRGDNAASALTTTSAAGSRAAVPPEPIVVGPTDDGSTVTLRVGRTLRIVLGSPARPGSTYWRFGPLPSPVLAPIGTPTVTPDHSAAACSRPGTGCGTVALTLTGRSAGTTVVTASRASCGEALRCPTGQDSFRLTVVVAR